MDDETDVTGPERPAPQHRELLDPGEEQLSGALRGALDGARHRPGLLARVQRRAELRRARQRMAAGTTLAGLALVAAVGVPSVLQDRAPSTSASAASESTASGEQPQEVAGSTESPTPEASPPPSPTTSAPPSADAQIPPEQPLADAAALPPVSATSFLSLDQVTGLHPEIVEIEAPAAEPESSAPVGGYCGATVLEGVAVPSSSWRAAWSTFEHVLPGADLGERVLRWESAEDAASFVAATRSSSTECNDEWGTSPEAGTLQVLVSRGSEGGGRPTALAVAPPMNPGDLWRVRAMASAGRTAVDLTIKVEADDALDAERVGSQLLDVALARAVRDDPSAS